MSVVQARNLNLKLMKWPQKQTRRTTTSIALLLRLEMNKSDEQRATKARRRLHYCCNNTALSLLTSPCFSQITPVNELPVELLSGSGDSLAPAKTLAQPKDDTKHVLDPSWAQVSTSSLTTPLFPSLFSPHPLISSQSSSLLHRQDLNSSFAKLVDPVFIAKSTDPLAVFAASSLPRRHTINSFPLMDNKPEANKVPTVMKALIPVGPAQAQPLCSTQMWDPLAFKRHSVVFSCEESKSSELSCSSSPDSKRSQPTSEGNKPSEEQLLKVKERLIKVVPLFFKKPHDYRIYNQNLVFINNFWGKEAAHRGLPAYMLELSKARVLSHLKYAHIQMNIVSISIHPEDGSIRLHWRVSGLPQLKTLQFWKFLPWTYRRSLKSESQFFDGISILFIGCDELIYKHKVDRLMPEEEPLSEKSPDLALKLGLMFGLLPRTGF